MNSCHIVRFFTMNVADLKDYKRFPAHEIQNDPGHTFYFQEHINKDKNEISFEYNGKIEELSEFMKKHKSVAFIIIKNDSICYERYFRGYEKYDIVPIFSAAKSFVSALIGIAIKEGKIGAIDDPVTKYIDDFKDPGFEKITIRDLLDMKSGIRYNEGYFNPFGDVAKFYYGRNLEKYCWKLKIKEAPGINYEYVSANTQLLAMVLESATGEKLSSYLESRIWKKIGMEKEASWSIDSKKHQNIKSFCCLNTNARDMAKLGRLYLNLGRYGTEQIVPEHWIDSTIVFHQKTVGKFYEYRYHWRTLPSGAYYAKGLLGQYLYVNPGKKTIIVRLGKSYDDVDWIELFEEL